jgi:hypothetical protein
MEAVIVLLAALGIVVALALGLRRHRRLTPDDGHGPEKAQRAESWLTKGSGRG